MAAPAAPRVWPALLRDILATIAIGILLGALFLYLQHLVNVGRLPWLTGQDLNLLEAGSIVLVGYLFARSVGAGIRRLMEGEGRTRESHIVGLVVNAIIALAVLFALFSLGGVSVQNLFFGSALAGIVLGLASQTVLANVFAGVVILLVGPFRPGERVAIVSSIYGALGPTYPHEMMYPTYTGTVRRIGLFYTKLVLDNGRTANMPNSVVLQSFVVSLHPGHLRAQRVRMTFDITTPVATIERALPEVGRTISASGAGIPHPRLEVTDLGLTSWDGVITLWTMEANEDKVRDLVMRAVLPTIPPPKPSDD